MTGEGVGGSVQPERACGSDCSGPVSSAPISSSRARRGTRSHRDRLTLALDLLRDPTYDALITGSSPFRELPEVMEKVASGSLPGLCHTIDYGEV